MNPTLAYWLFLGWPVVLFVAVLALEVFVRWLRRVSSF